AALIRREAQTILACYRLIPPFIPPVGLNSELKKRKKLEPTSIARPAASASSMTLDDVMPVLPSAAGQSLCCRTRTGLTSHQIAPALTPLLSTTWLLLWVGTDVGAGG